MEYLDQGALQNFDMQGFRNRLPYPWSGLAGILRPEAYARLREELPPVAMFQKVFGKTRRHGQQSHDRYVLEYEPGLDLPPSWRTFIDELQGPVYREWLTQAIGSDRFDLYFHWHYTPTGKSV